jgi:hypothetical protein
LQERYMSGYRKGEERWCTRILLHPDCDVMAQRVAEEYACVKSKREHLARLADR